MFIRPEWDQVIPYIGEGEETWRSIAQDKSSNQLVGVLVGKLMGSADKGYEEYFEGEGTEPPIPKYLMWSGKLKNRNLSQIDLCNIISDVWEKKVKSDLEVRITEIDISSCF